MNTFLFALALGLAAAGFVMSVANLLFDLAAWWKKRKENRDDA